MNINKKMETIKLIITSFNAEADRRDSIYVERTEKWKGSEAGDKYLCKSGGFRLCADTLTEALSNMNEINDGVIK